VTMKVADDLHCSKLDVGERQGAAAAVKPESRTPLGGHGDLSRVSLTSLWELASHTLCVA
jgi:hypothetical protein